MFKDTPAFSSFTVTDSKKAKDFYTRILGLDVDETREGLELRLAGGAKVFLYESDATAPEETLLNFVIEDIDATIDELAERGVRMEQYDLPEIKTDERGIFRGETGPKAIAWFKDPSGNIISVIQER